MRNAFFRGSLKSYPVKVLYEEIAFLAYYFHWSRSELMLLPHKERIKFCEEISKINRKMNSQNEKQEKNIFEV